MSDASDAFAEWMARVDRAIEQTANEHVSLQSRFQVWSANHAVKHGDLDRRLEAIETFVRHHREEVTLATESHHNPKHWGVTDGKPDPTVQLRRDVGTLVRAARGIVKHNWAHGPGFELPSDVRAVELEAIVELAKAVHVFEGDYE